MNKEEKITKKFYSQHVLEEWARLEKDPFHRLEFDTTMRFLKRYLPKRGLILDAGGGPGRYTIELAKLGYSVILLDLTPENLVFAREQIKKSRIGNEVKDIIEGSITDLSMFQSNYFDAVLCLGAVLSHVHPKHKREKAVLELIRVAKKGAPIFISVVGKFGVLMRGPTVWPGEIKQSKYFKTFYSTGDDYLWYGGKAFAHHFELSELQTLLQNKAKCIETVGLEGLATPSQDAINQMAQKDKKAWRNWLKMHNKLCTHPTVASTSGHFMIIAVKK